MTLFYGTPTIEENDVKAFTFILHFGIDVHSDIDETNTVHDFVVNYGSMEMHLLILQFDAMQTRKRDVIRNHDVFEQKSIPKDVVDQIGSFLLGTERMMNDDAADCSLSEDANQSGTRSPISITMPSPTDTAESSPNNLYEIEERLSLHSISSQ